MILAMLLAHLVGDYILQWNQLAAWKSRALAGVTVHCIIVFIVTWLFAMPFQPVWYLVTFIGVMHYLIDAVQFLTKPKFSPLVRFSLDQLAHFIVIFIALGLGGYLDLSFVSNFVHGLFQNDQMMVYLVGYAFLTMPAWVVIKFAAYGLVNNSPPEFGDNNKYLGILERVLMATFVILGQFLLVPFVVAPRLAMEWQQINQSEKTAVYLAEWLVSIAAAVGIGVLLSLI